MSKVIFYSRTQGSTEAKILPNVWIYWKSGSSITTFRTDATGTLMADLGKCTKAEPYADPTMPWMYTVTKSQPFGAQAEVCFSRGAKPVPGARIPANCFIQVKLGDLWPPPYTMPDATANASTNTVGLAMRNALVLAEVVYVLLPEHATVLSNPTELTLWPLMYELVGDGTTQPKGTPAPAYYTDGLNQGSALYTSNNLNTANLSAAPAVAAAHRPKERGLRLEGKIETSATGVTIQLCKDDGTVIQLRADATSTAAIDELAATMGAASSGLKSFTANIYLANAADAFGPILILLRSVGSPEPFLDSYFVQLTGLQTALVNDRDTNQNGTLAGSVPSESTEVAIIDFVTSPQSTLTALGAETRARRMVNYNIDTRNRPFSAAITTNVEMPEMPLWMAELHLLGVTPVEFRNFLAFRFHLAPFEPASLKLAIDWELQLTWDGPDANTTSPRRHNLNVTFTPAAAQEVEFKIDTKDCTIKNTEEADGSLKDTFVTAPVAIPFPVTGRRLPKVFLSKQKRTWGRQAGAPSKPAMVIEWQPKISGAGGAEIMRGGDGILRAKSVKVDGVALPAGMVKPGAAAPAPAPATDPLLRLPRFRVSGVNPASGMDSLVNLATQEYYDNHNTAAHITPLTLDVWQETLRRIILHESGMHYDTRAIKLTAGFCTYDGSSYGHEPNMPIFGPPHGYGYGQKDNPKATDDEVWSYLGNIKGSVELFMGTHALGAYNLLNTHKPSPVTALWTAAFRREAVRRYNGGTEFHWNGTAWEIQPSLKKWADEADHSKGPYRNLLYPNQVLGTSICYFKNAAGVCNATNGGASTTFPWPIAFT